MASNSDAENDENDRKLSSKSALESNNRSGDKKPSWKETCIGLWSQNIVGKANHDREPKAICKGINIIKIPKGTDEKDISPCITKGISIRIIETDDTTSDFSETPSRSSNNVATQHEQAPSLIDSVTSSFTKRKDAIVSRVHHYRTSANGKQDLWTDLQNSSEKQLTTARRLLSYAQPKEKITQIGGIMYGLVQNAKDWVAGRK